MSGILSFGSRAVVRHSRVLRHNFGVLRRSPSRSENSVVVNTSQTSTSIGRPLRPYRFSTLADIHVPSLSNISQYLWSSEGKRTHLVQDLSQSAMTGEHVVLSGWIHSIRDLGHVVFARLRDGSGGDIQIVVYPEDGKEDLVQQFAAVRTESVITVGGVVKQRDDKARRPQESLGDIEVHLDNFEVINQSEPLPIQLSNAGEETRLAYRYLDLRRPQLQENLRVRSRFIGEIHAWCQANDFLHIETPTLFKSTPEGAREFVVPTRSAGQFYALVQSPQQYKQMLMMSAIPRYYQIARCYRDEDSRADRQPEFTQLDMEMSFVNSRDIQAVIEGLLTQVFRTVVGHSLSTPFPVRTYDQVMTQYGSDKPDVRYNLCLTDLSNDVASFGDIERQETVRGLLLDPERTPISKGTLRKLVDTLQSHDVEVRIFQTDSEGKLPAWAQGSANVETKLSLKPDSFLVLASGEKYPACRALGKVREHVLQHATPECRASLRDEAAADRFNLMWVTQFPLVEPGLDHEGKRVLTASHHPFTSPHPDSVDLLASDIEKVLSDSYDLVLDGNEVGGGSIRIHDAHLQGLIFEKVLCLTPERRQQFTHLVDALRHGAPPHGGIALGLDRIMQVICGENAQSLRDVIAFPKTGSGRDLTVDSPAPVLPERLAEYHVNVVRKD